MKAIQQAAAATLALLLAASAQHSFAAEPGAGLMDLAISFGEQAEALREVSKKFAADDEAAVKAGVVKEDELMFSLGISEKLVGIRKASAAMNSALLIATLAPKSSEDAVAKHLATMCSELSLNPIPGFNATNFTQIWKSAAAKDFPRMKANVELAAAAYATATASAATNCASIAARKSNR
jgi:hypothetical protein